MFEFLRKLLAAPKTAGTAPRETRLGLDTALEARECPAALAFDDYCGNGVPRPPIPPLSAAQVHVAVVNPAVTAGMAAKGIIIHA